MLPTRKERALFKKFHTKRDRGWRRGVVRAREEGVGVCAYVWVDEDFDLALRGGARSVQGPNDLRHHRTNKTKQHTPRDCARTLSGKRVCNHRINQIIMIAPYHIRGKCGVS